MTDAASASDRAAPPAAHPDSGRLIHWLINQSLLATPQTGLVAGLGQEALAAGFAIQRLHSSVTMLHPRFESQSATWWRDGRPMESEAHEFGARQEERFLASPIHQLLTVAIPAWRDRWADHLEDGVRWESAPPLHLRYRLEAGEGVDRFPILAEFADAGATDYLLTATGIGFDGRFDPFADPEGVLVSWTTDRPGGFLNAEIEGLLAVQPALAAAHRIATDMVIARAVLSAYLGRDAGKRVLDGSIRRGEATTIDATILVADLRGFTALSDRTAPDAMTVLLDAYLEPIVAAVEAAGGEVLKFLGDGLLAIFPFDGADPAGVAARALAAAEDALARVEALNRDRAADGAPVMPLDVALHRGEVAYGNVGGLDRLDFTVIGRAVNEASRMEALCADLGCSLVASEAFVVTAATPARFRPLGRHALRGVREPVAVYGVGAGRTTGPR